MSEYLKNYVTRMFGIAAGTLGTAFIIKKMLKNVTDVGLMFGGGVAIGLAMCLSDNKKIASED